jgi:hypothetical protein
LQGGGRAILSAIKEAKESHIGVKTEVTDSGTSTIITVEDTELLEKLVNQKRKRKSASLNKLTKIIADNVEEGFDLSTEDPALQEDVFEDELVPCEDDEEGAACDLLADLAQKLMNVNFTVDGKEKLHAAICQLPGTKMKSRTFQTRGIGVEAMSSARSKLVMSIFYVKERNCLKPIIQSLSVSKGLWLIVRPPTLTCRGEPCTIEGKVSALVVSSSSSSVVVGSSSSSSSSKIIIIIIVTVTKKAIQYI